MKSRASIQSPPGERELPPDISLEWTNLSYSENDQVILHSVSGMLESGKLTAVIGPTGSGKRELLGVLSGSLFKDRRNRKITADISVCGEHVDPSTFRSNVGCVNADEFLQETATPQELMSFSADLRVPHSTKEDRSRTVSELLKALKLDDLRHKFLWDPIFTSGEKKRVAIGVELVADPLVLFLDEPFGDLDAFEAYTCMSIMKKLSASGVPIMITLERPTAEVLMLFDDVIVLVQGQVLYQGPTTGMTKPFEPLAGGECPPQYNPADFVLFAVCKATSEQLSVIAKQAWILTEGKVIPAIQARRSIRKAWVRNMVRPRQSVPFMNQFKVLTKREFRDTIRTKRTLVIRFIVVALLNSIVGIVFHGVGGKGSETYYLANNDEWKAYYGALALLCIASMFMNSQAALLAFPIQQTVFIKEYSRNMYGSLAYFLSRTFIELPLGFFQSLMQMLVTYWSIGLQGNFFYFVMVLWLVCSCSTSVSFLMSAMVSSEKRAIQLSPIVFIPQILFSGVFVMISYIPSWFRWGQYLAFLKYCQVLAFYVEFGNTFPTLAAKQEIILDKINLYIALACSILVGTRLLAIVFLRQKARY